MNLESIVYVGGRERVGKEWKQRRYTFLNGKPVKVPEEFAAALIASNQFVREDDVHRTVEERFPNGGTIVVRRWGALGDLLMFRAACAAFLAASPHFKFILRCQERFVHCFREDPIWAGVRHIAEPMPPEGFDGIITFDQVAEADHRGVEEHRAALFLRAMSKERITIRTADWDLPIPEKTRDWVRRHLENRGITREQRDQPLIAFQIRGSGPMKSLPRAVVADIIADLLDAGMLVILVEPNDQDADPFIVDDRVHKMTHRDALHSIEMMKHVDCVLTMDSGALWMAHCALAPTVCIMGPTRPAQRIAFHPLHPAQARAVCLNDLINCPPCFERAEACRGRFTCMQKQPDWKVARRAILDEVESCLRGDVRLEAAEASS